MVAVSPKQEPMIAMTIMLILMTSDVNLPHGGGVAKAGAKSSGEIVTEVGSSSACKSCCGSWVWMMIIVMVGMMVVEVLIF